MRALTAKVDEGAALKRVREFEKEIDEVLKVASEGGGIEVVDDDTYAQACEALLDVKVRQKLMAAEHEAFLEDVKRLLDRVNGWFKPAREKYGRAEDAFKAAIRDYVVRLDAKAHGLRKAAARLGPKDEARQQALYAEADAIALPKVAGISIASKVDFAIDDPSKLPSEFLMTVPDAKKIQLAISRGEEVKGVRLVPAHVISVTPKNAGREVV